MYAQNAIPQCVIAAIAFVSLLTAAGCQTAQPGTTDTLGRYDMVISAPPPRATRAAADVLEDDYKFKIDSSAFSAIDGKVVAETAQGTTIWTWVQRKGDNDSLVSVRVGVGDEKLSMEILAKIRDRSNSLMERIKEKM